MYSGIDVFSGDGGKGGSLPRVQYRLLMVLIDIVPDPNECLINLPVKQPFCLQS